MMRKVYSSLFTGKLQFIFRPLGSGFKQIVQHMVVDSSETKFRLKYVMQIPIKRQENLDTNGNALLRKFLSLEVRSRMFWFVNAYQTNEFVRLCIHFSDFKLAQ